MAISDRSLISLPFHSASQRFRGNGRWAHRQLCTYVPFEPIQFQHIWGNFHSASAVVVDSSARTRCFCSGCHTLSAWWCQLLELWWNDSVLQNNIWSNEISKSNLKIVELFLLTDSNSFNVNRTIRIYFESEDVRIFEIVSASELMSHWKRDHRKSVNCSSFSSTINSLTLGKLNEEPENVQILMLFVFFSFCKWLLKNSCSYWLTTRIYDLFFNELCLAIDTEINGTSIRTLLWIDILKCSSE